MIYEQIKTGNKIYHWNDNKKLIAEFDLSGSISSIEIFKTCVQYVLFKKSLFQLNCEFFSLLMRKIYIFIYQ